MGYSASSLDRRPRERSPSDWHFYLMREALYPIGYERSLSNRLRTWSHPRRKHILCRFYWWAYFNCVAHTWESRCYFVLDVAIMLEELDEQQCFCFFGAFFYSLLFWRFDNHSGKVTCATQLYESGRFDEQTIMSRTRHRSTAVRTYKRASSTLVKAVSNALQPPIGERECKIKKVDKKGKEETSTANHQQPHLLLLSTVLFWWFISCLSYVKGNFKIKLSLLSLL